MSGSGKRARRQAARVVVIAPDRATFLFRYDDDEIGSHWAMPGGGIEPGETAVDAAARELVEETGWTDVVPGRPLWTWEHDFSRFGQPTRQRDQVFLAYGPRRPPTGDLRQSHADDEILEWRWWTMAELGTTTEQMWPPPLFPLLEQLHANGVPTAPMHLGYLP